MLFTGYDLGSPALYETAAKVFYSKFGQRLRQANVNVDDTFSRFLISILIRNAGANPYSPTKGGPSNWCFMVARSVCSHAIDRQVKRETVEVLGWKRDASLMARMELQPDNDTTEQGACDATTFWG